MVTENKKNNPNRIPFEEIEKTGVVSAWKMPSMAGKPGRTVKSAELEAKTKKQQNNEVIENVSAAKKPRQLTAEQLLAITEEARKEGFEQGYQEGLQQGLAAGTKKGEQEGKRQAFNQTKAKVDQEHKRIQHIANALLDPMQEQDRLLENLVVDMAMNFAKGILRQELNYHPAHLYSVIHSALNALPVGAKNITVSLNQEDADLLDTIIAPEQRTWSVAIDNKLGPGGCRVETQESLVDYSIESRLARYFTDVFKAGEPDPVSLPEIEIYASETAHSDTPDNQPPDINAHAGDEVTDEE